MCTFNILIHIGKFPSILFTVSGISLGMVDSNYFVSRVKWQKGSNMSSS